MKREILINSSPTECRVALVEDGLLQEVLIESSHSKTMIGNIYKGTVKRVVKGMQSAFVSISKSESAFLPLSDIAARTVKQPSGEALEVGIEEDGEESAIEQSIRQGEQMLFQVTKEPVGTKAARVTTKITLASRYLVMTPNSAHIQVSMKIADESERERLKNLLTTCKGDAFYGFIARTSAVGVGMDSLQRDASELKVRWQEIQRRFRSQGSETLLYRDLPIPLRVLRDIVSRDITGIIVDDDQTLSDVQHFMTAFLPSQLQCLTKAVSGQNLFDRYGLEEQVNAALKSHVTLKSGGYLVIEQTEAMTTVDVNTGSYLGHRNLSETVLETNLEAARAIPRQLRLRNIGGIIVVDFIDMDTDDDKQKLLDCLGAGFSKDRAPIRHSEVSTLGLVEIARKRSGKSLQMMLSQPCSHCLGLGVVDSTDTLAAAVFRQAYLRRDEFENVTCLVLAAKELIDRISSEYQNEVLDMNRNHAVTMKLQVDENVSTGDFRLCQQSEVQ